MAHHPPAHQAAGRDGRGPHRRELLLSDRDVLAAALEGLEPTVGRLVRGPAPTAGTGATPQEVARAILDGGVDAALVLDDGELAGIVTTTDALVALAAPVAPGGPDET